MCVCVCGGWVGWGGGGEWVGVCVFGVRLWGVWGCGCVCGVRLWGCGWVWVGGCLGVCGCFLPNAQGIGYSRSKMDIQWGWNHTQGKYLICFVVVSLFVFFVCFYPKLILLCLAIHSEKLMPQTRWKWDVPRIFMVKNKFSNFFPFFVFCFCFFGPRPIHKYQIQHHMSLTIENLWRAAAKPG